AVTRFATRSSLSFFFYGSGRPRPLHSFPTRRSSDLALARLHLDAVHGGTDRDVAQRQGVAHLDRGVGARDHLVPGLQALGRDDRSEEHTSELQSRENLVCRLLLEKKNVVEQASPVPE